MDLFAAIAAERLAVADLLESLSDEQWNTQSACDDRTSPIGFDAQAPLCDVVVHRRDIEAPLGIALDHLGGAGLDSLRTRLAQR